MIVGRRAAFTLKGLRYKSAISSSIRCLKTSAILREGEQGASHGTIKESLKQSSDEKARKEMGRVAQETAASAEQRPRTLDLFTLEKKVAVVTGGARGLGHTFCRAFLESGCTSLAIVDLKQEVAETAATELSSEFERYGVKPEVEGFACDVASEDSVQVVMQEIADRWGKIDVLVASAGIVENYPAMEYPTSRMRKLYDINVHGAFFCAREVAKHMIKTETKGSIVLVASMSANIVNIPQPQTPYNASKAAVKHMAASLAVEWAPYGIRVNALSPGYMLTALTAAILEKDQALKAKWESLTPMGRMGDPEDLKGAVVYFASDASKFTTGAELRVDGAYTVV